MGLFSAGGKPLGRHVAYVAVRKYLLKSKLARLAGSYK